MKLKHCWLSMLISILMLFCTGLSVSATFLNVYDLNGDNQLDGFDLSLLKNEAINGNRPLTDVILLQRLILDNDVISSIDKDNSLSHAADSIYLDSLEVSESNTKKILDIFSSTYIGIKNSGEGELTILFQSQEYFETSIIAHEESAIPDSASEILEFHLNESRMIIAIYQHDGNYLLSCYM